MGNVIPLRRWKLAVLFKGLFPRTRRRSLCLAGLVGLLAHSFSHANAAPPEIPAELSSEYDGIEADYRNILLQPIATWRLGGIHLRYEALLKRAKEPAAQALIQARIERVSRQEELARSAATFETIVQKSRNRDREVNVALRNLSQVNTVQSTPFTARGLLQKSSRQVEGRRVYSLIGEEGRPIAYLDVPAGLDARPILSKRVGVRGSVRYDEQLGAKVIAVRDFEKLE